MRTFAIICVVLTCMVCFAEEPGGQGSSGNIYYTPLPIVDRSTVQLPGYVSKEVMDKILTATGTNDLVLRFQPMQSTIGSMVARIGDSAPAGWHWHFECEGLEAGFGNKNLYVMPTAKLVGIATEAVQGLGKSGRICEVYGHNWRSGRPGESVVESANGMISYMSMYADYHPNTNYRTCRICGLCQSQDLGWK